MIIIIILALGMPLFVVSLILLRKKKDSKALKICSIVGAAITLCFCIAGGTCLSMREGFEAQYEKMEVKRNVLYTAYTNAKDENKASYVDDIKDLNKTLTKIKHDAKNPFINWYVNEKIATIPLIDYAE